MSPSKTGLYVPVIAEVDFEAISAELNNEFRNQYPTFRDWQTLVDEWRQGRDLSGEAAQLVPVSYESFVRYLKSSHKDRDVSALADYAYKLGSGE